MSDYELAYALWEVRQDSDGVILKELRIVGYEHKADAVTRAAQLNESVGWKEGRLQYVVKIEVKEQEIDRLIVSEWLDAKI